MNHRKKIFLVEDDDDVQRFFIDALQEIDDSISVNLAENGEKVVIQLDKMDTLPDLIVINSDIHRMNAFDCLIHLNEKIRFKNIPIVIFATSHDLSDGMSRAKICHGGLSMFSLIKMNLINLLNFYFPKVTEEQQEEDCLINPLLLGRIEPHIIALLNGLS